MTYSMAMAAMRSLGTLTGPGTWHICAFRVLRQAPEGRNGEAVMADRDSEEFSRMVKERTKDRCKEIDRMIEALEAERDALKERDEAVDVMLEIFSETGISINSTRETLKSLAGFDLEEEDVLPRPMIVNRTAGADAS